jgi:hypothetical protein
MIRTSDIPLIWWTPLLSSLEQEKCNDDDTKAGICARVQIYPELCRRARDGCATGKQWQAVITSGSGDRHNAFDAPGDHCTGEAIGMLTFGRLRLAQVPK